MATQDSDPDGVAQYRDTETGLMLVLRDERMAEPGEHPAGGAIAYRADLYDGEATEGADLLLTTTYTVGPRHTPQADAKGALWSLAADALAARTADAPRDGDPTDITRPEVREAIAEYDRHYGAGEVSPDTLEGYAACVEAREAFDGAGADPGDVYDRLDR